jgi:hypothetical protein
MDHCCRAPGDSTKLAVISVTAVGPSRPAAATMHRELPIKGGGQQAGVSAADRSQCSVWNWRCTGLQVPETTKWIGEQAVKMPHGSGIEAAAESTTPTGSEPVTASTLCCPHQPLESCRKVACPEGRTHLLLVPAPDLDPIIGLPAINGPQVRQLC